MFGLFKSLRQRKVPDNLPQEVTVYVGRNEVDIRHVGQAEAGFSNLSMHYPEEFEEIMEDHGFDTEEVYTIGSGKKKNMLFLWVTEDLLMVTDTNPLKEKAETPEYPRWRTPGIAQLVGIEGEHEAVESFYEDLEEQACDIWDRNPNYREFL